MFKMTEPVQISNDFFFSNDLGHFSSDHEELKDPNTA